MVVSDHLESSSNLARRYTEYFIPSVPSPLGSWPLWLMLRGASSKHRLLMEWTHSGMSTLTWTFYHVSPWPPFYQSELSNKNRKKEKGYLEGLRIVVVVTYQNIPIAQHIQWKPNKDPDKLQMVAKVMLENSLINGPCSSLWKQF